VPENSLFAGLRANPSTTKARKPNPKMILPTFFDDGYELDDGEERHRESPSKFYVPPAEVRSSLQPGQIVKLIFRISLEDDDHVQTQEVERMWVIVQEPIQDGKYLGILDNDPECTEGIKSGLKVVFEPRHVIQVHSSAA
jgi:hypothetical protein